MQIRHILKWKKGGMKFFKIVSDSPTLHSRCLLLLLYYFTWKDELNQRLTWACIDNLIIHMQVYKSALFHLFWSSLSQNQNKTEKICQQNKKPHQNWMKNKNSFYLSNMWNLNIWTPFRNKIAIFFNSPSITH